MSMEKKTALTKTLSVSEGRAYFEVIPGEVFEFRCPRRSVWGDHQVMLSIANEIAEKEYKGLDIGPTADFDTSTCQVFWRMNKSEKDQLIEIAKNMLVDSMIARHPSANYRKRYMFPNPLSFGWYDSYKLNVSGRNNAENNVSKILYQICRYIYEDIDTYELVATVEHWELLNECTAGVSRKSGRL